MIVAVDFDGTLVEDAFPEIGTERFEITQFVRKFAETPSIVQVVLWTCRTGKHLEDAVQWCKDHEIPVDFVNENVPRIKEEFGGDPRKIYADYYIDDRCLDPEEIRRAYKMEG